MQVFISWSGDRSWQLAIAVRKYLRQMLQNVQPFFSGEHIPFGGVWTTEMYSRLSTINIGILCVTRECVGSEWMHFEAGALKKNENSIVVPYLLDVEKERISEPFRTLQALTVDENDTKRLIHTLNSALPSDQQLCDEELNESFAVWYPKFAEVVKTIPESNAEQPPAPDLNQQFEYLKNAVNSLHHTFHQEIALLTVQIERQRESDLRTKFPAYSELVAREGFAGLYKASLARALAEGTGPVDRHSEPPPSG